MSLIDWNDKLSVKVVEIDQQHHKLVDIINELNEAMKVGKGKDVLETILNNLFNYADSHFKTEEKYFERYGYPNTAEHIQQHREYIQKMAEFKDDFEKKNISLTIQIMNFLRDWWKNHILATDSKYSEFFVAQGLK